MAKISRCDKLPEQERLRLIGRIGDGISWPQLEREFGIPKSSIADWALRNGFGRSVVEAKRQAVDALLAQPESGSLSGKKPETGNLDTDAAAVRDAKVARLAAGVSVGIIQRLSILIQGDSVDGKEAVSISTALDRAWGTYARINKLDESPSEQKPGTDIKEISRRIIRSV